MSMLPEMDNGGGGDEEDVIVEVSPDGRFIRYEEVVGRGGLIKVAYKGFDQDHGNDVVWYQIRGGDIASDGGDNPVRRQKDGLLSEGNLLQTLKHDNIIKCHSLWVDNDTKNANLVTEHFNAGNLKQYRNKHKSVDVKAMKNWGKQILKGLHYLHTQNPPIVHRDLKCDNIFVNGNHGKVKIGNFGMATRVCGGSVRGVLGTPEFMAPEIYTGEYNELVDVYAFGMCMLEMVTCEYPYSECKNEAHIYKKVITGVKPAALSRVADPQIRILIEKCLAPVSQRLSVAELLQDPIFSAGIPAPVLESSRETMDTRFRLSGKRVDEQTILLILRISCKNTSVAKNIEFNFDLKADDALTIASELVEGKDLMLKYVPIVVDMMDSMMVEFQPSWKRSFIDEDVAAKGIFGTIGCREAHFVMPLRENGAVIARVD